MRKSGFVYIMTNRKHGTLYIGVTSDLVRRVYEHRTHLAAGFTARYGCVKLVYFEAVDGIEAAIDREKALKKWNREWKIELIERSNHDWIDLWDEISSP